MSKIRLLVVDDSFFMRKLLTELVEEDPDIEVVGGAKDGQEAVEMAKTMKPDVITMDYNMPEMNGDVATEQIMAGDEPLPAIIMLSASTRKGAEETLNSLRAGAIDFVTKPSGELSLDIRQVKYELLWKIKLAAKAKIKKKPSDRPKEMQVKIAGLGGRPLAEKEEANRIIVIGSSTGGPPAVEDILTALPHDLKAAILVVQHMPEKFTRSFADRLDRISNFHTKEAEEGEVIREGVCLIAPGNYHMEIKKKKDGTKTVHLNQDAPRNGLRPSIDITMESVAENYPSGIVGIILTGMGHDGRDGIKAIKKAGGRTIAQSPDTAVIDSMPSSIIDAGLADEVIRLEKIAGRIMELCGK